MRNPIAYFKHLVKDPVNTIDEVKARKKEILPWFIGSVAFAVLTGVAADIDAIDFLSNFTILGVAGIMFFGFLLIVANAAKKRFEALTCDKCNTLAQIKTYEDFIKYISYSVEKDEAVYKGYSGNKEPTNGIYSQVKVSATSSAVFSVDLTCPNCGEVKHLKYSAEPFKCHMEEKNVRAINYADIRRNMESTVQSIVNDYNDPERRKSIPYTFHSSKNPNFERRYEFKGANAKDAHPNYMGARIDYHKDAEEIFTHYFVLNELSGTLSDPNKSKKKAKKGAGQAPAEKADVTGNASAVSAQPTADVSNAPEPEVSYASAAVAADTIYGAVPSQDVSAASEIVEAAPVTPAEEAPAVEEPVIIAEETPAVEEPVVIAEEVPYVEEPVVIAEEAPYVAEPVTPAKAEAYVMQDSNEDFNEPPVSHKPKKDKQKNKSPKTLLIVLLSICTVLLIASCVTIGILITSPSRDKDEEQTAKPEETTQAAEQTDKVAEEEQPVANDYTGYWYIGANDKKELTIHSAVDGSATFSLWYSGDEEIEIKNVAAQLADGVADFSVADGGASIKGTLTFKKDAVTLEITESSTDFVPVEVLEFTRQESASQRYTEDSEETDEEAVSKVFYTVDVLTGDHNIYKSTSYYSGIVQALSVDIHAIIAETVSEDGKTWGKLDSDLGWVCVSDIYEHNAMYNDLYDKLYEEIYNELNSAETAEPELEGWQTAYIDYVNTYSDSYYDYALIRVDSDSVPELYVDRGDTAVILSYKNNSIIKTEVSTAYGSCGYIEGEGMLRVTHEKMDYHYDSVYKLDGNGFSKVCAGSKTDTFVTDDYGYSVHAYIYDLNGKEVSEEEYNNAFNELFNYSYASYVDDFTVSSQYIILDIENY